MSITAERKAEVIKEHAREDGDTGSPEVQVAILTERITGQETELSALSTEVAALAQALGLEERETAQLEARLGALNASLNTTQDATV